MTKSTVLGVAKYVALWATFVASSATTLYVVEGVPLWKGAALAAFGNLSKLGIVALFNYFWPGCPAPATDAGPVADPVVEVAEVAVDAAS